MLKIVRQLVRWLNRDPVLLFNDEVLGELTFNENWWECALAGPAGPITLAIGGHNEPAPELLERGRQVQEELESFMNRVNAFLSRESQTNFGKQFAGEITTLQVSSINLFRPNQPELGMIYFDGPDEFKLWHCDIDGDRLWGLTFDT